MTNTKNISDIISKFENAKQPIDDDNMITILRMLFSKKYFYKADIDFSTATDNEADDYYDAHGGVGGYMLSITKSIISIDLSDCDKAHNILSKIKFE